VHCRCEATHVTRHDLPVAKYLPLPSNATTCTDSPCSVNTSFCVATSHTRVALSSEPVKGRGGRGLEGNANEIMHVVNIFVAAAAAAVMQFAMQMMRSNTRQTSHITCHTIYVTPYLHAMYLPLPSIAQKYVPLISNIFCWVATSHTTVSPCLFSVEGKGGRGRC
jgi:hypothetical protein